LTIVSNDTVGPRAHKLGPLADPSIALKNADALLHDVLKVVDTSGDGQIQYNGAHGYMPLG
jgi:hypothetical protein